MRKNLLVFALFLALLPAIAQEPTTRANRVSLAAGHYASVEIGGGMQTFLMRSNHGQQLLGGGALFNLNYQYYITEHWGIGIGLGVSSLQGRGQWDWTEQTSGLEHPTVMFSNKTYDLFTAYTAWKETQNALALNIPIQAWYRTYCGLADFQLGLGLRVSIPVWAQYAASKGMYETYALFQETSNVYYRSTYTIDLSSYGFSKVKANERGAIALKKMNLGIAFDMGWNIPVSKIASLYVGTYLDYGFLNYYDGTDIAMLEMNGVDRIYNGAYNSREVTRINPIECGVKLGVKFLAKSTSNSQSDELEPLRLAEDPKALEEDAERERLALQQAIAEQEAKDRLALQKAQEEAERERLALQQAALERARQERLAREQEEQLAQSQKSEEAVLAVNKGVTFKINTQVPIYSADAEVSIPILVEVLQQNPTWKLMVVGHTDNTGTPTINMWYGKRRALAVKTDLVKRGVNADQIETSSKGQTEPKYDNATREGRQKNRRVEVQFIK